MEGSGFSKVSPINQTQLKCKDKCCPCDLVYVNPSMGQFISEAACKAKETVQSLPLQVVNRFDFLYY